MDRVIEVYKRAASERKTLGFWIYLMTDIVLFATLFATYAVLRDSTFGGPAGKDLFDLPSVLVETFALLTSSFTVGLALLAGTRGKRGQTIFWLLVTAALGVLFLTLELSEFGRFVAAGASWQRSGFLSAFFTLVGTHGAHITVGLIWMLVMIGRLILANKPSDFGRLALLSLFWHFLDIVWIFIFTFVYLFGVMS